MSKIERVYDLINCGPEHKFVANGRLVGNSDNLNFQNLPTGRKENQTDLLRRAIVAPKDFVIICFDASQIEARFTAFEANQHDLLGVFATGGDPYSYMASDIYHRPAEEIYMGAKKLGEALADLQRQMGKQCVLGCGYGMGPPRFQTRCLVQAGIPIDMAEARRIVYEVYRKKMRAIVAFWDTCETALEALLNREQMSFGGPHGDLFFADGRRVLFGVPCPGIRLPNGMWVNYPEITRRESEEGKPEIVFTWRKGRKVEHHKLYGGKVTENVTQAAAFALLKYQALLISKAYPVKLNTHDEWASCVPYTHVDEAVAYISDCMKRAPAWAEGLPLDCEGGWAQSYGAIDDRWDKIPDNPARVYEFKYPEGEV